MKPLLVLALLLAMTGARAQPGPNREAEAILRVVLAETAQVHAAATVGPPPCVRAEIGPAIGGMRRQVEESERPIPRPPPRAAARSGAVTVVNSRMIRFSPLVGWHQPTAVNRGYFDRGPDLPKTEELRLSAAERAVLVAPRQPRRVRRVESGWLRPPLAFCAGDPMQPWLEFSAPAIHGDLAFVEVDFKCVLCGQGTSLALRRSGGQWRIVAVALRWMS